MGSARDSGRRARGQGLLVRCCRFFMLLFQTLVAGAILLFQQASAGEGRLTALHPLLAPAPALFLVVVAAGAAGVFFVFAACDNTQRARQGAAVGVLFVLLEFTTCCWLAFAAFIFLAPLDGFQDRCLDGEIPATVFSGGSLSCAAAHSLFVALAVFCIVSGLFAIHIMGCAARDILALASSSSPPPSSSSSSSASSASLSSSFKKKLPADQKIKHAAADPAGDNVADVEKGFEPRKPVSLYSFRQGTGTDEAATSRRTQIACS